ncbi:hypothetical protein [uncultured Rhodoblastus sp.]|uniref:hypothetical protein n=1 Tax=uncultured Rhodoblastus sp. TaxID=543037 RepID=UPI0025F72DAB|nr:hypothetical protein [uncultured Rhodoblastus sp.]
MKTPSNLYSSIENASLAPDADAIQRFAVANQDILLRAIEALTLLAQLGSSETGTPPASILKPTQSGKPRFIGTELPRPLPPGVAVRPSDVFDGDRFQAIFQPGEQIEIYATAGAGLRRLSQLILLPAFKFGSTAIGSIRKRIDDLKTEKYAASWREGGAYRTDPDFATDWFASFITSSLTTSKRSPVQLTERSIVVTLPATMSPLAFEKAFRAALAHCSLGRFLSTPEGVGHCRRHTVDPEIGLRATGYALGVATHFKPSEELYLLRPRLDADMNALIVLLERLILRHLGLLEANP